MDINAKIEARKRELAAAKELENIKKKEVLDQQKMQLSAAKELKGKKLKEIVDQHEIQIAAAISNQKANVNSAIEQQNEKTHIKEINVPEKDTNELIEDEVEKRFTFVQKLPAILGVVFALNLWYYDAGFIPVTLVLILSRIYISHVEKTHRKAIVAERFKAK